MASRKTLLVLGVLLAILILATLRETEAARGSRIRSRRTTRRSPTRTRKTSRVPPAKPKLKTFHSSVTHSQTQAKKFPFSKRFAVAAAAGVMAYTVLNSPIHAGRYRPYHETSNIVIPKDRALKIQNERYYVERKDGSRCWNGSLAQYNETNVLNVTTKMSYEKAVHVVGTIKAIHSQETTDPKHTNLTVSAKAINDYIAHLEIRIAFKKSILTNTTNTTLSSWNATIDLTNCTVMVYESQAYVVESFAFTNKASFVVFLSALFVSFMV